jgi:hypothetical protein
MIPADFAESNTVFGPPPDMTKEQVEPIRAYVGEVARGSCEGARLIVVAWAPSAEERAAIEKGSLVYLTMIGGLAPHFLTTDFAQATNPR